MRLTRRRAIKAIAGAAALGAFVAGYWPVVEEIASPKRMSYTPDPQFGDNVKYIYSVCLGCNVRCGIKARVVYEGGAEVIERIEGNAYHPYNRAVSFEKQVKRYVNLGYTTPVKEAVVKYHGTLCAKGQDGIHYIYDPYRVLKPLRRAGPRGSGKWKEITWEELIDCLANGCEIPETGERLPGLKEFFVYGKLRGAGFEDPNKVLSEMRGDVDAILALARKPGSTYEDVVKAVEDFKAKWGKILGERGLKLEDVLIDPNRPDLGPRSNMVVWLRGRGQDNADAFYKRWTTSFGSVNMLRHTSACQLGYYAANALWAGTGDLQGDAVGAKVVIMAGASMGRLHPGATGQGLYIERAAEGGLRLYYVNPVAPRTRGRGNIIWVPVKPGYDGALAFAMIRWMIENRRYNAEFLSAPNADAAKKRGYPVYTNATWLVMLSGPRKGEFLRAADIGLEDSTSYVVYTGAGFAAYNKVDKAELEYRGKVVLKDGSEVDVATAFSILKEEAFSRSFDEWLSLASPYSAGTPEHDGYKNTVVQMIKDFADAAPRASTIVHRGVGMHTIGEYSVWAYRILDTLVGNFHARGGILGKPETTSYLDYLYNIGPSKFGEPPTWGPPITRTGYYYENTLEYWLRVKAAIKEGKRGEDAVRTAYPTKRPWYPLTPEESYTELFAGIAEGYPYPVAVLFIYFANPVLSSNYGVKYIEVLRDRGKLPLYVAVTTTIDETMLYADFIVPDTTYLETGTNGVQYLYAPGGGVARAEGWRSPVVMPLTQKIGECPNGHPRYASMWELLIDLGLKLGMPGYGRGGIPGTKGRKYEGKAFDLFCFWEYILRTFANAAAHAKDLNLIPENVPGEEVELVEANYPIARFKGILPGDEWRLAAYGLARGGVFTTYEESFDRRGISKRSVPGRGVLYLWNEDLARSRNSVTGEKFYGGPKFFEPATYAPPPGLQLGARSLHGAPLRELYGREYPYLMIFSTGPLYTKHRSQNYYWIKQIAPENFAVIHPLDAARLGIETGDVVRIESPTGYIEVPAIVEPTVAPGIVHIPYGMGRWADTLVVRPKYFGNTLKSLKFSPDELPSKAEVPESATNPAKNLPKVVKKILFTKSPKEYYEGLAVDEWRFNGVTPNVIGMADPSLGDWPLLSAIGASQAYYFNPVSIEKTGRKHLFKIPNIVW